MVANNDLLKLLVKFKKKIKKPPLDIKYTKIKTNSWFNMFFGKFKNNKINIQQNIEENIKYTKTRKRKIFFTKKQRKIILHWMEICRKLYNSVITYFRKLQFNGKLTKSSTSFITTRSKLTKIKEKLVKESILKCYDTDTQIRVHTLDLMIREVCKNVKAMITKFKNHQLKTIRLRYIKQTKPTLIIYFEPTAISNKKSRKNKNKYMNTFYEQVFGEKIKVANKCKFRKYKKINEKFSLRYNEQINNFNFRRYRRTDKEFSIQYNKRTHNFLLLTTIDSVSKKKETPSDWISLDPGIRTFLTGIADDGIVKMADNMKINVQNQLEKIDKMNGRKLPNRIKNRYTKIWNEKITNQIDDMHWKIIKYLTSNYTNIIIGKLSTKDIVNNKSSNISKMNKRVALRMLYYKFLQRLEYKCLTKQLNYKLINEYKTSKTCCNCGGYNKNLGGNKIYSCKNCKIKLDRDINGAVNILYKGID